MLQASFRLGTFFGIPFLVTYTWFIVFFLLTASLSTRFFPPLFPDWTPMTYWTTGLMASLLFFVSIAVHEFSHSLVSMANGIPVRGITLFIFGGVAQIVRDADTPSAEFALAIAGPASSLVMAVVFSAMWYWTRNLDEAFSATTAWLASINVLMAIFNLVPGFPLDGGRVLRAILWHLTGNFDKATRIAVGAGRCLVYLFVSIGLLLIFMGNVFDGLWLIAIGWFLAHAAEVNLPIHQSESVS